MAKKAKLTEKANENAHNINTFKDLNSLTLQEFTNLLQLDQSIAQEWKDEVIQMLENGIPEDISALNKLIEAEPYDAIEEIESKEV